MIDLMSELFATLRIPERVARIAPITAAPLVPSVDELMAMAMDRTRSDWLGDLVLRDATALGIALYCGDATVTICEVWSDENAAPPVPLCVMVALRERLIAAAWERIYSAQEDTTP